MRRCAREPWFRCRSLSLLALVACADPVTPPGEPHLEIVSAPATQAPPGEDLGVVVVRVVDEDGTPLPGLSVTWSGDGIIVPGTHTSGPEGLALARWQLPRFVPDVDDPSDFYPNSGLPGPYELVVSLPGQPATRFTVETPIFTVDRVEVGSGAACGLRGASLWCWGPDIARDIVAPPGGGHPYPFRPFAVPNAGSVRDVALAYLHLCVLDAAGTARCVGRGTGGAFVTVAGAPPLRTIHDGLVGFCGLAVADSAAWCWNWESGAMAPATLVPGSPAFASLGVGGALVGPAFAFGCGLLADGSAWCWGDNRDGALGDGTFTSRPTPAPVAGALRFTSVAVSNASACGLATDGQPWCWGRTFGASPVRAPVGPGAWRYLVATKDEQFHAVGLREMMTWAYGSTIAPDALYRTLPLRQLAGDAQDLCAVLPGGEVYCSANAVNGINSSSPLPELPVAVPVPE